MNTMKYVSVVIILLATILYANSPQDVNDPSSTLYKNKISYRIYSSSLSYYRVIDSRSNIRFNIDIGGSISKSKVDTEEKSESYGEIRNTKGETTYDSDGQSLGLLIQYLRYFKKSKQINCYFSIGPSFSIGRYVSDDESSENSDDMENNSMSIYNHKSTHTSIGATGTLGFEINLSKRIGVYGAYDLSYDYFWSDYDYESESTYGEDTYKNKSTDSEDGWDLGISGFQFGVFVSF